MEIMGGVNVQGVFGTGVFFLGVIGREGGICPGGNCLRDICLGGYMSGGICPRTSEEMDREEPVDI